MLSEGKILIVDDNEDVLLALNLLLKPHVGDIRLSADPTRIFRFMDRYHPDIILLDMNFRRDASSGKEGFYWLHKILEIDPQSVVIFMTAYADTEKAVQAVKAGATDFIPKPWEKDKLLATLFSALKLKESRNEANKLRKQVEAFRDEPVEEIIGESEGMIQVFEMIRRLEETDANILLLGENGTGKDLVARAVCRHSPRADKIFTAIDLGSIPDNLFESELFGYEKGAFTDAKRDKPGRMEAASGGTLFLDEIANISLPMQAKLLTAIEKKRISRLGSTKTVPIDVRFICATNTDVYRQVDEGLFRQDLLYRINTIEIHIPPLRNRGNDIILLAEHFINRLTKKYKKNLSGLSKDAKIKLLNYNWPGNVRELQHAVERALILSAGNMLHADDFVLQLPRSKKTEADENLNLADMESRTIEKALERTGGNLTKAAKLLGISRFTLYRKLK
jgi:DNA-binding NtrC family response regulator